MLIKDPTAEEIREATFAIHPDKAPGLMASQRVSSKQTGKLWVQQLLQRSRTSSQRG